jgi:hypothetical protein
MSAKDEDKGNGAKVTSPGVLTISAPDAQQYLDDNEVLEALYGVLPTRYTVRGDDVCWPMFYPFEIERKDWNYELLKRFPDVSLNAMPDFMKSDAFLNAMHEEILRHAGETGMTDEDAANVRVVIMDDNLLWQGCLLLVVVRHFFPRAKLFATYDRLGRGVPAAVTL